MNPSHRTLKLQALWLAASRKRVDIECKSKGEAVALRFQLYNAVKPIREHPALNPELAKALEVTQVSLTGGDKQIVTISRSTVSELLEDTFARLGITGQEVEASAQDAISLEAKASESRLLQRLGQGELGQGLEAPPTRRNPYNTRD